ncbi:hypothetical protein [Amycolatopsis sp. lyj-109]|uniref:hypothetical protein n=1 Tax=Amycolatopsis sp. lyj-109 TaxID=2789287 RepID=UPI00397D6724
MRRLRGARAVTPGDEAALTGRLRADEGPSTGLACIDHRRPGLAGVRVERAA